MKLSTHWPILVLAGLVLGVTLLNSFLQAQIQTQVTGYSTLTAATPAATTNPAPNRSVNNLTVGERQALLAEIIPKGIPEIYGSELGISFDQPETAIVTLSKLDGGWTDGQGNDLTDGKGIKFADLAPAEQQRYLQIASKTSCEFCCGARTLITRQGEAACGCAHSAAMRGLAKYLLKNHASEFSDQQILEQVTKIKTLSFPKQMVQRALELQAAGQPVDSVTQNLPTQVGGC